MMVVAWTGSVSAAVSRPAGWACRPRLGVLVGRRQVPCRPAPSAVSAAEGLCRTAALESAEGLLCRTAGRLAHGFHKDGKKIPALT
jgi:hypothetical protein